MKHFGRNLKVFATVSVCTAAMPVFAEPLKLGIIETFSGPQVSVGAGYRAAARYAIEKINAAGGWNGQPVVLKEYDNLGTPTGATEKLKGAIAEGVQIVFQGGSSAIAGQISEDVRRHNLRNPGKEVLFLNFGAEALELTSEKCHFHHARFATHPPIRVKALVSAMKSVNALGTKVYSINQNYSFGHDMQKAIEDNAASGGYQVVGKTLHDVNKIQDFAPYVTKIAAESPDTVITGNWSSDLLQLMKASKAAGLKTRFATLFLDQPGNVANAGNTAMGHYVAQLFNAEAAGEEGAKFVADYKAKTGRLPAGVEPQTVTAFEFMGETLKRTKPEGGALNVNTFIKNMETTKLKAPMGEVSLRAADHQALLPVVVGVVTADAKYKVDDTDMGFKPVKLFSGAEASAPVQASCKMQRPS